MYYILNRIIFFLFEVFFINFFIVKSKGKRKIIKAILLSVLSLLFSISICFVPIENIFGGFHTPEDAFHYSDVGEIQDIIYGKYSVMIQYKAKNDFSSSLFLKKADNAYMLSSPFSIKSVANVSNEYGTYGIINFKGDYYVRAVYVSAFETGKTIISDNKNSNFKWYYASDVKKPNIHRVVAAYAFIDEWDDDYCLVINGEKINFYR